MTHEKYRGLLPVIVESPRLNRPANRSNSVMQMKHQFLLPNTHSNANIVLQRSKLHYPSTPVLHPTRRPLLSFEAFRHPSRRTLASLNNGDDDDENADDQTSLSSTSSFWSCIDQASVSSEGQTSEITSMSSLITFDDDDDDVESPSTLEHLSLTAFDRRRRLTFSKFCSIQ
jgi:hypothetical protein